MPGVSGGILSACLILANPVVDSGPPPEPPPLRQMASGCAVPTGIQTLTSTYQKAKFRNKHVVMVECDTIQIGIAGFYVATTNALDTSLVWTATSLKIQFEIIGATTPLVRANIGGNDAPQPAGDLVLYDEVPASAFGKTSFMPGDIIWSVQEVDYPSTLGVYTITDGTGAAATGVAGEGTYYGGNTAMGVSGNLTTAGSAVSMPVRASRPALLLGRHNGVAVAAFGDSIVFGNGVSAPSGDGSASGGFVARACYSENVACVKMAKTGSRVSQFVATSGGASAKRRALLPYFTHAWFGLGFNDVNVVGDNSTAIIADTNTALGYIVASNPDIQIVLQEITIRSNAASGTTTAGQTTSSGFEDEAGTSERGKVNLHRRGLVATNDNVIGSVSMVSVMGDATVTTKWFVNATNNYASADGTHPTQTMDGLMATYIRPTIAAFLPLAA
jgi:hypothetical protein